MGNSNFETYLVLMISGFGCDPSVISTVLSMTPSKTYRIGDPKSERNPGAIHEENGWIFRLSADPVDLEIDSALERLQSQVGENVSSFKKLPLESRTIVTLAVYAYQYMPALSVSLQNIEFLNSLRAGLDFDIYNLTSNATIASA